MNPTRAEIDFAKLAFNLAQVKKHIHRKSPSKKIKVCGVVKANAYGHGLEEISTELVNLGIDYLGVANYDGKLIKDTIKGKFSQNTVEGTFTLYRINPKDTVAERLPYNKDTQFCL